MAAHYLKKKAINQNWFIAFFNYAVFRLRGKYEV